MVDLPAGYKLICDYEERMILTQFNSFHPEPYVIWKCSNGILYDGMYFTNPKDALDKYEKIIYNLSLKEEIDDSTQTILDIQIKGSDSMPIDVKKKDIIELSEDEIKAMNFSNKLKYFRKKKRLTQENLAEIVEVSSNTIRSYEANRRHPTGEILLKLAKALNVPAELLWINSRN